MSGYHPPIRTIEDIWIRSIPEPNSGCWLWANHVKDNGYGQASAGRPGHHQIASRRAYILAYGPIPDDIEVDHLCRVRCCVNPAHLEAVTNRENKMRGRRRIQTHCGRGHLLAGDNLIFDRLGRRKDCRECNRLRCAAHNARKKP
jgi:hypothetical protein